MRLHLAGLVAVLVWLIAAAAPLPAAAQARPLDAPRAAGTVGERFDGFAELRDAGAAASVKALVEQTNAERRALYQRTAQAQGTTPDAVGRIYAAQIMAAAPPGTWFRQESGAWVRR